jgi:hypothetical protein
LHAASEGCLRFVEHPAARSCRTANDSQLGITDELGDVFFRAGMKNDVVQLGDNIGD